MGLGDAIICAPIIAKHAAENPNETIWVPAWVHNHESVKSFFVNYPNVSLILFHNEQDYIREFVSQADIKLGFYNHELPQLPGENFIMWFYRQAQMRQADRWKWCPIQDAAKKCDLPYNPQWPIDECVLVQFHELFRLKVSGEKTCNTVPLPGSILRLSKFISQSPEIHVLDSSLLHLAEALETKGRLIYHKYARPNSTDNYQFRKQWTTIKE